MYLEDRCFDNLMWPFSGIIRSAKSFFAAVTPLARTSGTAPIASSVKSTVPEIIKEPTVIATLVGAAAGFAGNMYLTSKTSKDQEIALAIQKRAADSFEDLVDTHKETLRELKFQNSHAVTRRDLDAFRDEMRELVSAKKEMTVIQDPWASAGIKAPGRPVSVRSDEVLARCTEPNNSIASSMKADFKQAGLDTTGDVFSPKPGDTVLRSSLDDFGIDLTSAPTALQVFCYTIVFLQLFEAARRVWVSYRAFGNLSQEFQKARTVFEVVLGIVVISIPTSVALEALINRAFTSSMSTVESVVLIVWLLTALLAFVYFILKFLYSSPSNTGKDEK